MKKPYSSLQHASRCLTGALLLALTGASPGSLIGHWTFDEGTGTTAADSSGNGLTATTTASTTWIAGVSGTAANDPKFTLSDSSSLALADGNTAFTISLWANTTTSDDFAVLAGFEGTGGTGDRYAIKTSGGNIEATIGGAVAAANLPATSNGNWIHIVAVNDPTAGHSRVYVNGVQSGEDGGVINLSSSSSEWTMGTYWNSNGYDYTGALDDVQVYDQALTLAEVVFLNSNPGSALEGGGDSIALSVPSANTITDEGATVECQVFNDDADEVTLVWAKSDQGETDIGTWTSADGGGSHSFGAASQDEVLSHALSGFDGDTSYSFRFFATAGGDSDWSNAGSFATGLGGSPAPTDLAGTPDTTSVGTKIDLTWTDSYASETGFLIQRSTDPGFGGTPDEFSAGADETSFTDETTEANTTYYYRIAAEGSTGTGPFSDGFEVMTGDDPPAGLIGHWTFDDGEGTVAVDSSGSGFDADVHLTGEGSGWITGKTGGAYNEPRFTLDAAESDDLNLPGGSVTISVWVTEHSTSQYAGLVGFEGAGGPAGDIFGFKMSNADTIIWTTGGGDLQLEPTVSLTDYAAATADGWVHLVGTYDGVSGTSTMYVNGVSALSATTGAIPDKTPPSLFRIGTYYNSDTYEFNGAVDDVQIYNYAISAEDVTFLHSNPGSVVGDVASAIALWVEINGAGYDFSWNSRSDKIYDLVSSTDLTTPPESWPVYDDGNFVYENIEPSGTGSSSLTGVAGIGSKRFFAVIEKDALPF